MRLLSLFIFVFSYIYDYGQNGSIRSKLVDKSNNPVAFASVYLMKATDSSQVLGANSAENGSFILERIPINTYLLRISAVGYQPVWQKVVLTADKPDHSIPKIVLSNNSTDLSEVNIDAERKLLESSIDKKTFTVDKSIISQSGSATDAIQQLPSVTLDESGNLQMRGSSNILILINGKPIGARETNLQTILNQIPANTIDKIEVITNPSSKFDAEGANGIINIILKQNKNKGVNGNVNVQAGTRDKNNFGLGLSFGKGKLTSSLTYGYRDYHMWWNGYLYRQIFTPTSTYYFNTLNHGTMGMLSHAVNFNTDYTFNKNNSLSVFASGTFGKSDMPEWIRYTDLDSLYQPSSDFIRYNDIHGESRFYNFGMAYTKKIDTTGRELNLSANYSINNDTSTLNGSNSYNLFNYMQIDSIAVIRQNRNIEDNRNALAQLDYILPLSRKRKLETGLKTTYRSYDNEMRISSSPAPSENYSLDSSLSNRFFYSEIINAAYFNFSGTYKNVGYQFGSRVEQTLADGELKYTGQKVGYHRLDFFPSVYLVKKIKKSQEWKVNYTRRIERPSSRELNPFSDLSDPRNFRQGNPDLKPQFIHSYELEYSFTGKKIMTNPNLYYKQTNNLIWRYITLEEGVNYVTFENIGKSYNIGLDWVTTYKPNNWLNTLTSINVFYNRQKGKIQDFEFDNNNVMYNIRQTLNVKVKKKLDLQLTYNYNSPFLSPQGKGIPRTSTDFGASIPVLKNKGTLTLTFTDLFNQRNFGIDLDMPNVEQSFFRKRESRIVYLGFNYRFGKQNLDRKTRKRENNAPRNDDGGGGL
ncbi:MAG: TonB-dependent receptor [Flavobacteriales bacterium]|nr:TonB-dependent receptor [Flavobacteriales bacterium]